jgi:hypothetical protein
MGDGTVTGSLGPTRGPHPIGLPVILRLRTKFLNRSAQYSRAASMDGALSESDFVRLGARALSEFPRACRWNIMAPNVYAVMGSESWEATMNHRGVEFTVAKTAIPGIWQWQFRIGERVKTGKTETKIDLLAIRRVQLRIDRELKAIGRTTA